MLYHLSFQIVFETNWESNPPIDIYDYLFHLQLPQAIIYQSSILPISYFTPYSPSKGSGKSYLLYYSVKCMNCTNIRRVNYICHAFVFCAPDQIRTGTDHSVREIGLETGFEPVKVPIFSKQDFLRQFTLLIKSLVSTVPPLGQYFQ